MYYYHKLILIGVIMRQRPLSPHLQVYRPQITSVLSITHRITGFSLFFALILFVGWMAVLAMSESCYAWAIHGLKTIPGQTLLWLSLAAFYYHLGNGIRHLVWDYGVGFEMSTVRKSGWFVIIFTIAATLMTWSLCK